MRERPGLARPVAHVVDLDADFFVHLTVYGLFERLPRFDEARQAAVHRNREGATASEQRTSVVTFDQHDDRGRQPWKSEQPARGTATGALTGGGLGRRSATTAESVRALPLDELHCPSGDGPCGVVDLSPQAHERHGAIVVVLVDGNGETGTPVEQAEADGGGEVVLVTALRRVHHRDRPATDDEDDGVGHVVRQVEAWDEAAGGHAGATVTSPTMQTATRHAPQGMVASVDHLASSAGVSMLRQGGSAADAAVAASAVLAVTCPHLCGMGGDLFALVHDGSSPPAALNASGRAGAGADPAQLRRDGFTSMPFTGDIRAVPVPGCVDGWLALHERYGRLPLAAVFEPAVVYAASGFPASPLLAAAVTLLAGVSGADDLVGDGRIRHGDLIRRPGVVLALEAVLEHGRSGFYQGPFGQGLLELGDGEYASADLARRWADWVEPLHVRGWDHDVWTIPPNSQGYLTLLAAAIAEGLPLPASPADSGWAHALVES